MIIIIIILYCLAIKLYHDKLLLSSLYNNIMLCTVLVNVIHRFPEAKPRSMSINSNSVFYAINGLPCVVGQIIYFFFCFFDKSKRSFCGTYNWSSCVGGGKRGNRSLSDPIYRVASGFWRKLDVRGPSVSRSDGWHKIRQCRQQLRLSTLEDTDEMQNSSKRGGGGRRQFSTV